jgi:hypothetical protein
MTKPKQPRPLTKAEKLIRFQRIARGAKRRGLVDISDVDDAPIVAVEDDGPVNLG